MYVCSQILIQLITYIQLGFPYVIRKFAMITKILNQPPKFLHDISNVSLWIPHIGNRENVDLPLSFLS